jgi:hypothetical protein
MVLNLYQLVKEYGKLKNLEGFTPQSRGQRLNGLIAELFLNWGISAKANLNGNGEIDVAFELAGKHFILEAKWEEKPIDTGPIAKLQKRLRQRLGGTLGIFISINGYTKDALKDLKDGEQLMVVCLERVHLEAMLSGLFHPKNL